MEKVVRLFYIVLFFFAFNQYNYSQELISTGSIYYNAYKVKQNSNRVSSADVKVNGGEVFEDLFTVEGNVGDAWSAGVLYGLSLKWDKNMFNMKIGGGVDEYSYNLIIKQVDTIPGVFVGANNQTGQDVWENVRDASAFDKKLDGAIASPYINFEIGYSRSVWMYKGWEFLPSLDFRYRRAFFGDKLINQSFLQTLEFKFEDDYGDYIEFPSQQYLKLKENSYFINLGIDFRYNASVFGLRYGFSLGEVSSLENVSSFNVSGFNFSYSKVLDVRKLAKEQLIADSDMGIPSLKTRKYRKGDRMFYASYFFDSKQMVTLDYETVKVDSDVSFEDANQITPGLIRESKGVNVRPNVSFKFGAASFFTHRLLLGAGLGVYVEKVNRYGVVRDTAGTFFQEVKESDDYLTLKNDVFAHDNFNVSTNVLPIVMFNSAIYLFKYQLPVDPFVKGTFNFVLTSDNGSISELLKGTESTIDYGEPYYSIYTLSAGADVKLRMRSSKYLVFSVVGDYHFHPHGNFMQIGIRIGRYKKKKLKSQRY